MTDFQQVRERALGLLARREFSSFELRQRLFEKTSDVALVDEVLKSLIENNLQCNQRFVASYVRRRAAKGFGPLHIEHELKKHKIDSSVIKHHLASDEIDWRQTITRLFERKFGVFCLASDQLLRSKQMRFLQSRGFNMSQINQYLEKVNE